MIHPKVRLRAIEPEDLDTLYKIENDRTLWGIGPTNVPYSRFALHQYIEDSTNDIYIDKQVRLMIDNEDGETVGIIDLMNFSPQHKRAEVGIVIMVSFRKQGYGTAALSELLVYVREVLHLHQLYIVVPIVNSESVQLFTAQGFCQTAVLTDWLFDGKEYQDAYLMQLFLRKS